MAPKLSLLFVGLVVACFSTVAQVHNCKIKIIRLKLEKDLEDRTGDKTDSILTLAKLTTTILLDNSNIEKFSIKTDTACCNYAGQIFTTSHHYLLASVDASKIAALNIPLCCGIPIAVYVDDKEVYRALLWNPISSFGSKSLTVALNGNTLIVTNQLPGVPNNQKSIPSTRSLIPDCLQGK